MLDKGILQGIILWILPVSVRSLWCHYAKLYPLNSSWNSWTETKCRWSICGLEGGIPRRSKSLQPSCCHGCGPRRPTAPFFSLAQGGVSPWSNHPFALISERQTGLKANDANDCLLHLYHRFSSYKESRIKTQSLCWIRSNQASQT